MKTILILLILTGMTLALAACNTVEGAGKDTKAAGQSIENAADNNK
jgi:entericidin B